MLFGVCAMCRESDGKQPQNVGENKWRSLKTNRIKAKMEGNGEKHATDFPN